MKKKQLKLEFDTIKLDGKILILINIFNKDQQMMESKIKQKLNYIKNKFETIIDFRKK